MALKKVQGRNYKGPLIRENINSAPIKSNNFTWRPAPSKASEIKEGIENKTLWPALPSTMENSMSCVVPQGGTVSAQSDTDASSEVNLSSQQMVKSFLNYNKSNYQAIKINKNKTVSNDMEEIAVTDDKATFVLGVLAVIDKSKTKFDAKYLLCQVASAFLYKREVVFKCPGL